MTRNQPRDTTGIRLSQTAPWNHNLTNGYRDRYTEVAGHYFKISADFLYTPWFVSEITAEGKWIDTIGCSLNLVEARNIIAKFTS